MIEDIGEILITEADDSNIPVDIWIVPPAEDSSSRHLDNEYPDKWTMRAGNYMPRKGQVADSAYEVVADTREELVEIVKTFIIPLYQAAVNTLQSICQGTDDNLCYWTKKEIHNG